MEPYDLISVDWNEDQTAIWLLSIKATCPHANIRLIKDTKPISWCWSSGKIGMKDLSYDTSRVIYTDTDVLFMNKEVGGVFDIMPDSCVIGATHYTTWHGCTPLRERAHIRAGGEHVRKKIYEIFRIAEDVPYKHYSSGMLVFNTPDVSAFMQLWFDAAHRIKNVGFPMSFTLFDEVALSLLLMGMQPMVYDLPKSIHNNILSRTPITEYDHPEKYPMVLHYHQKYRLRPHVGIIKWMEQNCCII